MKTDEGFEHVKLDNECISFFLMMNEGKAYVVLRASRESFFKRVLKSVFYVFGGTPLSSVVPLDFRDNEQIREFLTKFEFARAGSIMRRLKTAHR